ncbi:MAG: hypothetical protein WKF76_12885 [Nocardioidaceae bacterium]
MTTTPQEPLRDDDIETAGSDPSVQPTTDADGTDGGGDADGTDGGDADTTDGGSGDADSTDA